MLSKSINHDLYPLLKLAFPLILTGMVGSSIGFFETVFLAHLNQETLAAGALVSWLFAVFVVIIFGTLSSINILISHKHGAQDKHGISLVLRDGLLLAIIFSIPAFLLFWNMAPLFLLFGQSPHIVFLAKLYLHALAWGLLPTFLTAALFEFVIGLGHARVIMVFTALSVVLALFFSFSLIFGQFGMPALGIAGAGWGISISYWITSLVLITYILLNKDYRSYFRGIVNMKKPSFLWELIKLGLPMGVMYCFEVAFFFALTLIMGSFGDKLLAANQIALQYMGALMSVIFCIAQAITVRMGHLIGANDRHAAKRAAYAGLFISGTFMACFACVYWLDPTLLISIDFDVHAPENIEIVHYAKQLFAVSAIFQLLEATRISLFGALRALQDTHFTLISSIISFWCIALPVGYLLATRFNLGGPGLWWGMSIGAGFSMLLLHARFRSKISIFSPERTK